jgi:hypothetical protein
MIEARHESPGLAGDLAAVNLTNTEGEVELAPRPTD